MLEDNQPAKLEGEEEKSMYKTIDIRETWRAMERMSWCRLSIRRKHAAAVAAERQRHDGEGTDASDASSQVSFADKHFVEDTYCNCMSRCNRFGRCKCLQRGVACGVLCRCTDCHNYGPDAIVKTDNAKVKVDISDIYCQCRRGCKLLYCMCRKMGVACNPRCHKSRDACENCDEARLVSAQFFFCVYMYERQRVCIVSLLFPDMSIRIAATKEAEREITNWQCPSNSKSILRKAYRKQLRQLLASRGHSKTKNDNIRELKSKIRSLRPGAVDESEPSRLLQNKKNGPSDGSDTATTDSDVTTDDDDEEEEEDVDVMIEERRKRKLAANRQLYKRFKMRARG